MTHIAKAYYIQRLRISTGFALQCDIKSRKSYVPFEDSSSAEPDILFNESSTSDLHGASPKTWSKSLDSRLIGNGYDAF